MRTFPAAPWKKDFRSFGLRQIPRQCLAEFSSLTVALGTRSITVQAAAKADMAQIRRVGIAQPEHYRATLCQL
jgi:uncharacterized protein YraI